MNKFFLIGIILIIATIGYAQNSLILEVKIEDNNKIDQELIKSLSLLKFVIITPMPTLVKL